MFDAAIMKWALFLGIADPVVVQIASGVVAGGLLLMLIRAIIYVVLVIWSAVTSL
jgi:hypothetical protein